GAAQLHGDQPRDGQGGLAGQRPELRPAGGRGGRRGRRERVPRRVRAAELRGGGPPPPPGPPPFVPPPPLPTPPTPPLPSAPAPRSLSRARGRCGGSSGAPPLPRGRSRPGGSRSPTSTKFWGSTGRGTRPCPRRSTRRR